MDRSQGHRELGIDLSHTRFTSAFFWFAIAPGSRLGFANKAIPASGAGCALAQEEIKDEGGEQCGF